MQFSHSHSPRICRSCNFCLCPSCDACLSLSHAAYLHLSSFLTPFIVVFGAMQNSSLRLLQLHHCSIQNMQNQLPIDALSAGVGLGMINPKAALESKVTAAVAPKFHRQPRLRGHPLHTIRSQEPGPGLSPAPMIIVAFFSSGLLWMANPKMALGSKAVVAEVSSRPSR